MGRNVAAIILHNSERKILLQQRTDDAPTNPSKWGFFGGGIKKGESEIDAVKRETFEELGYKLKNPTLVYEGIHPEGGKIFVYSEEYDSSQELHLYEGKARGWFSVDEIKDLDVTSYMYEIIIEIADSLFV